MIIEIKDTDFFLLVLQSFTNYKQVDITISEDSMLIECIEIYKIYVNLDKSNFTASSTRDKFSVDPSHLYKSINVLNTTTLEVLEDHISLRNDISHIIVPLLSTIEHQYEEICEVHTKFMIHPKNLHTIPILQGLVRYEIENDTLFIRRIAREVFEEIELREVDFIEAGELSFPCNNNWSEMLEGIRRNLQGAMFLFSDSYLSVQLLFKENENVYFEIQVMKSMTDF